MIARYRANSNLFGPRRIFWGLAIGLLIFLAAVVGVVWTLDMRVTAEALAHHGKVVERQVEAMVRRMADEEFAVEGGGFPRFAQRLEDAVKQTPGIEQVWIVRPGETSDHPCLLHRALSGRSSREHAAGELQRNPVGCIVLPVEVDGAVEASVLLHLRREWAVGGELVQSAVRQTAWQLAPVFVGFYLLLGVMLLTATRAAQRWRVEALQAQRVETLGALASGVQHEIKNPLNALGLCLQVLDRRHRDEETRETLTIAHDQSRQIAATLDEFAKITRVTRLDLQEVEVGARIRERAASLGWPLEVDGEARVQLDPDKMLDALESIVELLVSNAPANETIRIRLGAGARSWHVRAEAPAADLDPNVVAHLFDPYVRARPRDVGRGLAWAHAVFQAHGGDLQAAYRGGRLEVSGQAANQPGV